MPHSPLEPLLVILTPCSKCKGEEYYDSQGESCACNLCQSGYQSVALPLWEVLALAEYPEPDRQTALSALVEKAQAVRHPLLYNVVDVPSKFVPPLKMSATDMLIFGAKYMDGAPRDENGFFTVPPYPYL